MSRYFHPNHLKYIKAPTIEMIEKVMESYGVGEKQFERFFGIYAFCVKHIRQRKRSLPVQHWHIIYECLKLIDAGLPLPLYKEDRPKPPENKTILSLFKNPNKKRTTTKKYKVKRTGSLCELC